MDLKVIDHVLPFTLDGAAVRGRLVRLRQTVTTIRERHNYPDIVQGYLSEMCALLACLVVNFKHQGISTLQVSVDNSPIKFMVADITHDGDIRACASFDDESLSKLKNPSFIDLFAGGRILYTVDMVHTKERYQTIVAIEGESFAEAMHSYFRQSEQVPTAITIYQEDTKGDHYKVSAIILQQIPKDQKIVSDDEREDWLTDLALMATVTKDEMLEATLTSEDLLFRLFHEREVRVNQPKSIQFSCRCSKDKSLSILSSFSIDQLYDMKNNDGKIHMNCEFCNQTYDFLPSDLKKIRPTLKSKA